MLFFTKITFLKTNLNIYAFEPASNNFNLINQNIKINKMDEKISALSVAFSDQTQIRNNL